MLHWFIGFNLSLRIDVITANSQISFSLLAEVECNYLLVEFQMFYYLLQGFQNLAGILVVLKYLQGQKKTLQENNTNKLILYNLNL